MSTEGILPDLLVAMNHAAYATEFDFPLYRDVNGVKVVCETITVSTVGQTQDGRWQAQHGPAYCMADSPEDWIILDLGDDAALDPEWDAFMTKATFSSLDRAMAAAKAEQAKTQAEIDALPPWTPDNGAYRAPETVRWMRRDAG